MSFIYLATPYSHKDPQVRQNRYEHACKVAGKLMEEGNLVFCPIAHSHAIETVGMTKINDGNFWLRQDFAILKHADFLYVCMMPGWGESHGVREEVKFAQANKIPVAYIDF